MAKANAPALPALQVKFHQALTSCNQRLVERAHILETAWVAIVGRVHVFYLGPPGTAKSLAVRVVRDHIGGFQPDETYERLLTAFSTDSDVFGGPDLMALEQGITRKVTENTLVPAKLGFLDEIFKCNDATLNALLTALNERLFHNDVIMPMPLWSLFGASNELPQSSELDALYDRLHFRHIIKPIQERGSFVQMLKNRSLGPVTPCLTVEDVETAQAEVAAVTVSDEVFDALADLRSELRDEGIEPTDRRWSDCLPVVQATAWWNGSTVAEIDDMRLIRHMLWTRQEEIQTVSASVLQLASPLEAEANKLSDEVAVLREEFDKILKDADNDQQRNRRAIELHTKLDRSIVEVEDLEKRMSSGGRRSVTIDEMKNSVLGMIDVLLKDVFRIDPNRGK